jgi:molybdenum cofactor biosynthesis protein B
MGHEEHKAASPRRVRCWVVTVSDTRTEANDESGAFLVERLTAAGHKIVKRLIVSDDREKIWAILNEAAAGEQTDAVILSGGTGIAPRDCTIEAVNGFIEKEITGFGELFRRLSYYEIGTSAILSRATAGMGHGIMIFAIPGSTNAVRLAVEKIIVPEIGHAVYEMRKSKKNSACAT